jgi:redox-sensitive bicupin YhaK (pirin superfamily)
MSLKIIKLKDQPQGGFDNGNIIENKPVAFPNESKVGSFSNLFYWANALSANGGLIDLHPHKGFEIMSYILKGSVQHYDTSNDKWFELEEGDVQLIKAGSGISHAEKLMPGSRLFQIWFDPGLQKSFTQPAQYHDYKKADFIIDEYPEYSSVVIKSDNTGIDIESPGLLITDNQFKKGFFKYESDEDAYYSIYVIEGIMNINDQKAEKDDFILSENTELNFEFLTDSRLFIIKSPKKLPYKTYTELMGV